MLYLFDTISEGELERKGPFETEQQALDEIDKLNKNLVINGPFPIPKYYLNIKSSAELFDKNVKKYIEYIDLELKILDQVSADDFFILTTKERFKIIFENLKPDVPEEKDHYKWQSKYLIMMCDARKEYQRIISDYLEVLSNSSAYHFACGSYPESIGGMLRDLSKQFSPYYKINED